MAPRETDYSGRYRIPWDEHRKKCKRCRDWIKRAEKVLGKPRANRKKERQSGKSK